MKRSRIVQLTLVSSVAALLLSCRDKPTRYCVDDYQSVVDDPKCEGDRHHHWYYGGAHGFVPYGTRLSGGSTVPPSEGFSEASRAGTQRGVIGGAGEEASGGGHGAGGEGAGE